MSLLPPPASTSRLPRSALVRIFGVKLARYLPLISCCSDAALVSS
ncbi:hypothetical protein E2C01_094607 [Portunus trituberculatus]|uniref:Uncharacterized protein n=1 Tax=Portunus trituberculatus TaxID=210409 RepID=A0A5B7K1A2_PORTR|nr:hypothetical protein [Portunus trituberculatus]